MRKIFVFAALTVMTASCSFVNVKDGNFAAFEKIMKGNIVIDGDSLSSEKVIASENAISKTYQVADFWGIYCSGAADIKYSADDSCSVEVNMPDNLVDVLEIDVKNSILFIGFKKSVDLNGQKLDIKITSPKLNSLDVSGAVKFESETPIKADAFNFDLSGAADFEIDGLEAETVNLDMSGAVKGEISGLNCKTLNADASGASNLELSGVAQKAEISMSGAGKIDIEDLDCKDLDTDVSGFGKIKKRK